MIKWKKSINSDSMAKLGDETLITILNIYRQLLELIHEAKGDVGL